MRAEGEEDRREQEREVLAHGSHESVVKVQERARERRKERVRRARRKEGAGGT